MNEKIVKDETLERAKNEARVIQNIDIARVEACTTVACVDYEIRLAEIASSGTDSTESAKELLTLISDDETSATKKLESLS
ncbi:MAG: hypothetical protein Q7S59_00445 [Sulfurimonas sp.]|nr:hypothetical protein [Sulfurimonas sp.]